MSRKGFRTDSYLAKCPKCAGVGKLSVHDDALGNPQEDCGLCSGKGSVKAEIAGKYRHTSFVSSGCVFAAFIALTSALPVGVLTGRGNLAAILLANCILFLLAYCVVSRRQGRLEESYSRADSA